MKLPTQELDERRPIETLFRLCRRPKVILDIGAGEGQDALRFRVFYPDAKVYCFEPIGANYRNLANNAATLHYLALRLALGETNGDVEMFVTAYPQSSSCLRPALGGPLAEYLKVARREFVPCRRLDDWLEENKIGPEDVGIVKLDTQGTELAILRGAPDLLKAKPIIILEVMYAKFYEGQPTQEEIEAFMSDAGYRLECAYPSETMPELWNDSIFVPG